MQRDPRPRTDPEPASGAADPARADDDRAVARYLYLLRTAPPDAIEQVHAEAFAALTDAQRRELLERIGQVLPPYERALATPVNGTPIGLARLITRAEMRQPGTVARLFGPGLGVGAALGASLLGGIAGAVAASALAAPFLAGAMLAAGPFEGAPATGAMPAPDGPGAEAADDLAADDQVAGAGSGEGAAFDLDLDGLFDA